MQNNTQLCSKNSHCCGSPIVSCRHSSSPEIKSLRFYFVVFFCTRRHGKRECRAVVTKLMFAKLETLQTRRPRCGQQPLIAAYGIAARQRQHVRVKRSSRRVEAWNGRLRRWFQHAATILRKVVSIHHAWHGFGPGIEAACVAVCRAEAWNGRLRRGFHHAATILRKVVSIHHA